MRWGSASLGEETMNRLGLAITLAAGALWSGQAAASDELTPRDSANGGYHAQVRAAFTEAFDPSVRIRAIVEPPHGLEFVVGVRQQAKQYRVFLLQTPRGIWGRGGAPTDPKALARCEVGIGSDLAHRVIEDWAQMLHRIDPEGASDIGMDGVGYHFSMGGRSGPEGKAWSPEEGSKPGRLAHMVYALRDYCLSHDAARLEELDRLSNALQDQLKSEPK
jgi:hypothetical protein